jgi:1A family penicillin-binding protein
LCLLLQNSKLDATASGTPVATCGGRSHMPDAHRRIAISSQRISYPIRPPHDFFKAPRDFFTAQRDFFRAHHEFFVAAVVIVSIAAGSIIAGSIWWVHDLTTNLPTATELRGVGSMSQATTLYDANSRPAFTIFREQRTDAPLSAISPHLVRAIVAIEDQRFYDHGGVDVVRIVAAALTNMRAGRAAQGGSTLTQQLVRRSFLTPDKTLKRKVKEAILAWRLERQFTKDQILELYLNKVYFGDGLYGVEAASLGFFGKHAKDLDVPESALLAGLVKAPSTYAPTVNLDRAMARRNLVLGAMRDIGAIDRATFDSAVRSQPRLADALRSEEAYGQYFKEEVRKQLVQRFGWDRVYQGGLKVYTTIDLDMQKAAEREVARSLADIEQRQATRRGKAPAVASGPLQGALVAMDPLTGEVRAMVGGRDFDRSHFNRATQAKRQAGSAFKPFVYATALELGYTPATLITGLSTPIATLQGEWVPADEHLAIDAITMRAALRTSSNRAAVQMLQQVSIPMTVRYAQRLGIGGLPAVPSLALGSGEVTLLSMTSAYSAFANQGMVAQPLLIRRVEDASGEVLFTANPHQERAISEATAFIMASMMADVINAGTAWQARKVGFTLPAAGKTGTTNDYRDVWFVGFTPHLVAGVWIGYDQPRTILGNGYAGDLAVPLWGRFMASATHKDPPDGFRMPSTVVPVTICRLSGRLPGDSCQGAVMLGPDGKPTNQSMVYTEYFVRGTEPIDMCPLHGGLPNAVATSGDASAASLPVDQPRDTVVPAGGAGTRGLLGLVFGR